MSYERIVKAFSRMYGHFAAVMDAEFNVLWASETVHPILGVDFPVGRNVLDVLHPDDMALALEAIPYHSDNAETYSNYDATWMPEYSSLRFDKGDGTWVRAEVTVFNMLDDPEVGALVGFGRRAQDRSDVPLAIDLVGSGAPLDQVLPSHRPAHRPDVRRVSLPGRALGRIRGRDLHRSRRRAAAPPTP